MLINELLESINNLLKDISKGPFVYYKNKTYFKNIFNLAKSNTNDNNYKNNIMKFIKYFNKKWLVYFGKEIFNYYKLLKIQRYNSYIENYNRRIRPILGK